MLVFIVYFTCYEQQLKIPNKYPQKPPKNPLYTNDKHDSGGDFWARGELIIAHESWFFQ